MSMTCDPGHMVRVVQVRYGYTADAADCHQTKDDCVMTLPEPERYACIGRQQCDINLPSGGKGRYLPRCYHFSTRMEIRYQCIPRKRFKSRKFGCLGAMFSVQIIINLQNQNHQLLSILCDHKFNRMIHERVVSIIICKNGSPPLII